MTKKSRIWAGLAAKAALVLTLAGCSNEPAQQQTPGASPTTKSPAPTGQVAAPTATSQAAAPSTIKGDPPAVPNAADAKKFSGTKLTLYGDAVGSEFDKVMAKRFTQDTGIEVNVIPRPKDATESYATFQRLFQGQSADVDVLMLDVIWPGAFADNLIDLSAKLGDIAKTHVEGIVQNNTVNGKLIAMPWYTDFPMLYYRTDLLQKHGFAKPPETWDELEQMAKKIVDAEKGANASFTGFVWQGKAYEGLTCNGLEWIFSHGGGAILDGKKPALNNPQVIKALSRAKGWIGTISPAGVTTYEEEDARNVFQAGNAVFMRNWPYAYSAGNADGSAVKGKFDVAPLPHEPGQKSGGTIGGWQLAVSKYSKNQDAAVELVRYFTSPEAQKFRALQGSFIPTITSVQQDADVVKTLPFLAKTKDITLVPRPSSAAGARYNEVSIAFFQGASQVLQGQDPAKVLPQVEQRIDRALR